MSNTLSLTVENIHDHSLLKVSGRLDANHAGYLDDKLSEMMQDGKHFIGLDLKDVVFLSSAGIRILIKQHKAFKNVNGELYISEYSENVRSVLEMVGLSSLFERKGIELKPLKQEKILSIERHGYRFTRNESRNIPNTRLQVQGNPEKMKSCSFTETDNQLLKLSSPFFGLGIGAFGESFVDCKNRYGEFLALGDVVACLPSDSTKTPDYMIKTGNLLPEINTLYRIGIENSFQHAVDFTGENSHSIALTHLAETMAEIGNHKNFAMLMIAESNGLVGASLKVSPASGTSPFSFPQVRNNIKFTSEPAHLKALTVVFGIFSVEPDKQLRSFLRSSAESSTMFSHVHAAVFPYMPMRKENVDYRSTINARFNDSQILDVLHLLNDSRDISGLGESLFKSGHCWTTELEV